MQGWQNISKAIFILFWGILYFLPNTTLLAQETTEIDATTPPRLLRYELGLVYGKTLNIHPFFPNVNDAYGFEFSLLTQTTGRKYWHQFYKYPVFGVSILGMELGNDSILGQAIGAYPFMQFPKKLGNKFEWTSRIGFGLAGFTKLHDPFNNPDNYVIGSRITALAVGQTGLGYHISPQLALYAKIAFIHYSNGHVRVPNIGANIASGILTLKYTPKSNDYTPKKHELKPLDKKWRINLDFGLGLHEIEGTVLPVGGPKYPVYFGSLYTSKRIKPNTIFSVGFNLNYFTAFHDYIINQQIFDEKEKAKSLKGIVFIGYEWLFGHLAFNLQPGINVYYPFRKELINKGLLDKRTMDVLNTNYIGFKYYAKSTRETIRNNPFLGFGLRTIGGKADFVETRVGLTF